ncbi:MAG: pilus assembly protein [Proteobacteria bacterium]|nr:pilus assembly protein [Pseudomonadota bacterium]
MYEQLVRYTLSAVSAAKRRLMGRKASVALIFAISAPMLLAVTGLSVDVGYWYQDQTTLQSAADAAALAAASANAQSKYNVSTAAEAQPYAVTAANNASNSRFNLTNASVSVALTTPSTPSGTVINQWQATAVTPRGSFFSRVSGEGLTGLAPGTQSATAVADYKTVTSTTGGSCLLSLGSAGQSVIGNVAANGKALVDANGCNIYADSNACGNGSTQNYAIQAVGNATIETTNTTGDSIFTAGCTHTSGGGQIFGAGGTADNNYNIVDGASVESDPLYYMGDAPTFWYDNATDLASIPNCLEKTLSGSGNSATVLIYPPTGNDGDEPTNSDDDYDPPLTYCLYNANSNAYSIPSQGTVYFCQTSSCSTDTGTALTNYGTNSDGQSVSYFFNNGFTGGSQTNVYFGPGIYYFDGSAPLKLVGGSYISTVGTGSTFVFEGTTSYNIGGSGTALDLLAPNNSADCVSAAYYNAAADSQNSYTNSLYGMSTIENGQGICGLLIYEARNDTAAGQIDGSGTSTVNGVIYTPKASFSSVGGGSISAVNGGTLAVLADNFNVTGLGTLNVTIGSGSNDLAASLVKTTTTTTSSVMLVQ